MTEIQKRIEAEVPALRRYARVSNGTQTGPRIGIQ